MGWVLILAARPRFLRVRERETVPPPCTGPPTPEAKSNEHAAYDVSTHTRANSSTAVFFYLFFYYSRVSDALAVAGFVPSPLPCGPCSQACLGTGQHGRAGRGSFQAVHENVWHARVLIAAHETKI